MKTTVTLLSTRIRELNKALASEGVVSGLDKRQERNRLVKELGTTHPQDAMEHELKAEILMADQLANSLDPTEMITVCQRLMEEQQAA